MKNECRDILDVQCLKCRYGKLEREFELEKPFVARGIGDIFDEPPRQRGIIPFFIGCYREIKLTGRAEKIYCWEFIDKYPEGTYSKCKPIEDNIKELDKCKFFKEKNQ